MKKATVFMPDLRNAVLAVMCWFYAFNAEAQGFLNSYPSTDFSVFTYTTQLECTTSGYCVSAYGLLNIADSSAVIVRLETDEQGHQLSMDTALTVNPGAATNHYLLDCNEFFRTYLVWVNNQENYTVASRHRIGDGKLWEKQLDQLFPGKRNYVVGAISLTDGNTLIVGGEKFYLQKLSPAGTVISTATPALPPGNTGQFSVAGKLRPTADGGAIGAVLVNVNGVWKEYLYKAASDLSLVWFESNFILSAGHASDGSVFILNSKSVAPNQFIYELTKYNPAGGQIWAANLAQILNEPEFQSDFVLATTDNGAVVCGRAPLAPGLEVSIFARFDGAGNLLWKKTFNGNEAFRISDGKALPDGNFVFSGVRDAQLLLVKIGPNGAVQPNAVAGKLVEDANANCIADAGETPFPFWIVRAVAQNNNYFTVTDASGNYRFDDLPGGPSYAVELTVEPISYLWQPCAISPVIMPDNAVDVTLSADIGNTKLAECPAMQVSVATPLLRRCVNNGYYIKYCNNGTALAQNAKVEVYLPAEMTMVGSTLPYTLDGQTVRFELGEVPEGFCGDIPFTVYVSCDDTQLGQALCVEARIFPDSFCVNPPNWSGACIETRAKCNGDSVHFELHNSGKAPTTEALEYLIIDDDVVMFQGNIPAGFQPAGVKEIDLAANGSTLRIQSEQEPNHPADGNPSIAVEGCNGMTTGFVTAFPNLTGNPFSDLECKEIIASFDPNDKQANPEGIHEEHFIYPGTRLDYTLRFQNTGTDTAFRVVLRDTLSSALDVPSLRVGPSSHPYSWTLDGAGILIFTFDPIALPDSSVNMAASNGFVRFSINTRSDVPLGTLVKNSAGIYFDANSAVLTNTVFHTLDEDFLEVDIVNVFTGKKIDPVKILPNPAMETVVLEWPENASEGLELQVFDQRGILLQRLEWTDRRIVLQRRDFPSGMCIVKVVSKKGELAVGKIIWK